MTDAPAALAPAAPVAAPAAAPAAPSPTPAAAPAAAPASAPAAGPWWEKSDYGLSADAEVTRFLAGKNFPDLATALRSGMHADGVARDRNALSRPDPQNVAAWDGWQALGWEPDASKYKLTRPQAFKDAKDFDEGMLDAMSKAAHELRIPAPMAQGFYEKASDYLAGLNARVLKAEADGLAALEAQMKQDWGADYEPRRTRAAQAMRALGVSDAEAAALEELKGAPAVLGLFDRLGKALSEDQLVAHQGSDGAGVTPWGAKAQMAQLAADPEFMRAMNDPRAPDHADAKARWEKLSAASLRAA